MKIVVKSEPITAAQTVQDVTERLCPPAPSQCLGSLGSMAWEELGAVPDERIGEYRNLRRAKLYADEDIENYIIDLLRAFGVNIQSARELPGHLGKPDEWHAAYALKKKRFLLTKNTKDYWSERRLPWQNTYGVIAVEGDLRHEQDYYACLQHVVHIIIPDGELYVGTKIESKPEFLNIKGRTREGRVETMRFRFLNDHVEVWVEEGSAA